MKTGMETTELFSNVHKQDLLGFKSEGKTNYEKVAQFLSLNKGDVSKISDVKVSSVRFDERIPEPVRERLDQIHNICQLVAEHFGDPEKTALWFKIPNPLLGNISPRDMIRFGRYKRLMQFILDARKQSGVDGQEKAEAA